jgi:hypothetical protein
MEVIMKNAMLLLSLGIAGCSVQPSAPPPPATAAAGGRTSCIDLKQVIAKHALAPNSVLFEMNGGISYRNDLQGTCPGIARANGSEIIQTESQSAQLCVNDSIRVYDPIEARATGARSFAKCRLGLFTAVPNR